MARFIFRYCTAAGETLAEVSAAAQHFDEAARLANAEAAAARRRQDYAYCVATPVDQPSPVPLLDLNEAVLYREEKTRAPARGRIIGRSFGRPFRYDLKLDGGRIVSGAPEEMVQPLNGAKQWKTKSPPQPKRPPLLLTRQ